MRIRVTAELQPELLDLLRSLNLEYVLSYTLNAEDNTPQSISIRVKCIAISINDLERLESWGHFIVCPVNPDTLELYTSLPSDIKNCII